MRIAKLVHFGRGGDTVYYGEGCIASGYGSPERPHAAKLGDPVEYPDGTPVVDVRAAVETDEGYRWVFKGPMCNPDIPDGEVDECPMPSAVMAGAMGEQGGPYAVLLAQHVVSKSKKQRSGLDSVSIAEYLAGWKEHGARIGEYQNGQIVWFD